MENENNNDPLADIKGVRVYIYTVDEKGGDGHLLSRVDMWAGDAKSGSVIRARVRGRTGILGLSGYFQLRENNFSVSRVDFFSLIGKALSGLGRVIANGKKN